jgi:MFS family permease
MFHWYTESTPLQRRTFLACFGGWSVDALSVQVFTLVIPALIAAWNISKAEAGILAGVSLVTGALGGWFGGALSDRLGRVRALQITVLWFAVTALLCAFCQNFLQLLIARAVQGFGFGAEWAAGAVLLAETIRPEHRGKAMGTVQSGWAVGWGASVLLYAAAFSYCSPDLAWRLSFAVGTLPALLVLLSTRGLPDPDLGRKSDNRTLFLESLLGVLRPDVLRVTLLGGLLGFGAHGGFYGLFSWLPTYLKTERGLSVMGTGSYLGVIIVAFFLGCVTAGYLLDWLGRRRTVLLFALGCTAITVTYLLAPISGSAMLVLGFPLGFCAAGIPASMGALFSELYPAGIRGSGVGFCYNFGRILSAALPPLIGYMSGQMSLGAAIGIDAGLAYGLVVVAVLLLPETRGKNLQEEKKNAG